MKLKTLLLALGAWAAISSNAFAATDRPNVIVIMADDLGYGDISSYGATEIQTPRIDALAAAGTKFTSGYTSASTCTPTRFSFLSGVYAFRKANTGIAPPNGPLVVDHTKPTIASVFQAGGYKTAVIGKWHLGLGGPEGPQWNEEIVPGPRELGFGYSFLLPTTNDRVPQVYLENGRVLNLDPKDPIWVGNKSPREGEPTGESHRHTLKMDWSHGHNNTIHNGISRIGFYTGGNAARFRDEDLADAWVERSVKWIEDNRDNPFFLFFASHDLHVPRMPHERFHGKSKLGFRGDSILQLDWCVGEIVDALERNGLRENTLIVFCSDNGPVLDDGYKDGAIEQNGAHRPAGRYLGGKYSVYEGGTRTPFITYWPGKIPVGENDQIVSTVDLFASLARIAGVDVPSDAALDSVDVSGVLLGQPGAVGRKSLVQQDNGNKGNLGFRDGDWKLVWHESKQAYNTELRLVRNAVPTYQLFNLAVDPSEQNDLFEERPEIAAEMLAQLKALVAAPTR